MDNCRRRIEDRRVFTYKEKELIIKKSDGVCCHCGKNLVKGDFTVEHVIPLSKGGNNDISNLVGLCKGCNELKGNYVYNPLTYYPYLKDKYKDELICNQENYYTDFSWFSKRNMFPEDCKEVKTKIELPSRGRNGKPLLRDIKYIIKKAKYYDLDEIYNFILKYNIKYNLGQSSEEVKCLLSDWFNYGCIYFVKNRANEVIAVFPIRIFTYDACKKSEIYGYTVFDFNNFICIKEDMNTCLLIYSCVVELLKGLLSLKIGYYSVIAFTVQYYNCNKVSNFIGSQLMNSVGVEVYEDVENKFTSLVCVAEYNKERNILTLPNEGLMKKVHNFSNELSANIYPDGYIPDCDIVKRDIFITRSDKKSEKSNKSITDNEFFTKEEIEDLITKDESGKRKEFVVDIDKLVETDKCKRHKNSVTKVARIKYKRNKEYTPIRINSKMEVIKNFESYYLLLENKCEKAVCTMEY